MSCKKNPVVQQVIFSNAVHLGLGGMSDMLKDVAAKMVGKMGKEISAKEAGEILNKMSGKELIEGIYDYKFEKAAGHGQAEGLRNRAIEEKALALGLYNKYPGKP